jgi:hypothetical protein
MAISSVCTTKRMLRLQSIRVLQLYSTSVQHSAKHQAFEQQAVRQEMTLLLSKYCTAVCVHTFHSLLNQPSSTRRLRSCLKLTVSCDGSSAVAPLTRGSRLNMSIASSLWKAYITSVASLKRSDCKCTAQLSVSVNSDGLLKEYCQQREQPSVLPLLVMQMPNELSYTNC